MLTVAQNQGGLAQVTCPHAVAVGLVYRFNMALNAIIFKVARERWIQKRMPAANKEDQLLEMRHVACESIYPT
jgi:hypothetical protein